MGPADVLLLIDIISSLLAIFERNKAALTTEQRQSLHDRTLAMIAKAEALAD